ncbi:MAG: EscU/YscU/HrcU family type III secretion system export apparatus switch protein [Planctomycetota bacterium]
MAEESSQGEKTEEATPKRIDEAREKGQVALSQDFIAALMLLGAGVSFLMGGASLIQSLGGMTADHLNALGALGTGEFDISEGAQLLGAGVRQIALPLAMVLIPMLAVGLLAGYGQIGFKIAGKALEIQWSRFDVVQGAKRIFGMRGVMRLLQALLKIGVIATVLISAVYVQRERIFVLVGSELGPWLEGGLTIVSLAVIAALFAVLVISMIDLIYQKRQFAKDQRMTKEDVKRERKQDEGDPQVKGRIRAIQREMAMRRMMQDVPDATVVVTNPTHFAVALRYEPDIEPQRAAPVVIAKGMDAVAQEIKRIARDADVPLYEDVPLARGLYARTEIGDEVPEDLYQAVATVIQFVWRMRDRTSVSTGVEA